MDEDDQKLLFLDVFAFLRAFLGLKIKYYNLRFCSVENALVVDYLWNNLMLCKYFPK